MASNIAMLGNAYGQDCVPVDRQWTPADVVDTIATATFAATQDIRTMDAFLTAQNAGYWTALRLAQESANDKVFWIRNLVPGCLA